MFIKVELSRDYEGGDQVPTDEQMTVHPSIWMPNPACNEYVAVEQYEFHFQFYNPSNHGIEITIHTAKPKHYMWSNRAGILEHWKQDLTYMGELHQLTNLGGGNTQQGWGITTNAEPFDPHGYPMLHEQGVFQDGDLLVREMLVANDDFPPFAKRNASVHSSYKHTNSMTKQLAPGETFNYKVVIPAYNVNFGSELRNWCLHNSDTNMQSYLNYIKSLYDQINGVNLDEFVPPVAMPTAWPKGRNILIEAKSCLSVTREATAVDLDGGAVIGSGAYICNVTEKIKCRILPAGKTQGQVYVDGRQWDVPAGQHEAFMNVENDHLAAVQAFQHDNNLNDEDQEAANQAYMQEQVVQNDRQDVNIPEQLYMTTTNYNAPE